MVLTVSGAVIFAFRHGTSLFEAACAPLMRAQNDGRGRGDGLYYF